MSISFDGDDEDDWEDGEPEEVHGPPLPSYTGSRFEEGINENDVHAALEFLVAMGPPLGCVNTRAEYEAAAFNTRSPACSARCPRVSHRGGFDSFSVVRPTLAMPPATEAGR